MQVVDTIQGPILRYRMEWSAPGVSNNTFVGAYTLDDRPIPTKSRLNGMTYASAIESLRYASGIADIIPRAPDEGKTRYIYSKCAEAYAKIMFTRSSFRLAVLTTTLLVLGMHWLTLYSISPSSVCRPQILTWLSFPIYMFTLSSAYQARSAR